MGPTDELNNVQSSKRQMILGEIMVENGNKDRYSSLSGVRVLYQGYLQGPTSIDDQHNGEARQKENFKNPGSIPQPPSIRQVNQNQQSLRYTFSMTPQDGRKDLSFQNALVFAVVGHEPVRGDNPYKNGTQYS
jgi:hypothetical protein